MKSYMYILCSIYIYVYNMHTQFLDNILSFLSSASGQLPTHLSRISPREIEGPTSRLDNEMTVVKLCQAQGNVKQFVAFPTKHGDFPQFTITMENQRTKWTCSLAMLVYQRLCQAQGNVKVKTILLRGRQQTVSNLSMADLRYCTKCDEICKLLDFPRKNSRIKNLTH